MNSTGDVEQISNWLRNLEEGDADAAQKLWDRYFHGLLQQAENRIGGRRNGAVEAEDVAVSVFESLCAGAQKGRFKSVKDRDELWWLLLKMTNRKVISAVRVATAAKRGNGNRPVSIDRGDGSVFFDLVADTPTPEDLVTLEEEFHRALALLPNETLRDIAVLMLEGYTSNEISHRLNIAIATVTRKKRLIRETWKQDLQDG
ncbi:ECF-type sigma factor [Bremerella sp. JC770]|uniref:ECF-type sigma factor n=1 Tax=Bremerella sp. JC770 TaxID=3232137 RepID=UPI003457B29B